MHNDLGWNRNITPTIFYNNNLVEVKLILFEQVADMTDLLQFKIGNKAFKISLPHINPDGSMRIRNTDYIGITKVLRPVITNTGVGRDKVVEIQSIHDSNIRFFVTKKANHPSISYGNKFYFSGVRAGDQITLAKFPIRPVDREWMNNKFNCSTQHHFVTLEDIRNCYSLYGKPEWNWKHLNDLRFFTIMDSFLCFINSRLWFLYQPTSDNDTAQSLARRFWSGNSQVQWVDPNLSDIARLALTMKVHYPVGRFDDIEDCIPDPSTVGVLDMVSTPVSDKAGSICSLSHNVSFVDGTIVRRKTI